MKSIEFRTMSIRPLNLVRATLAFAFAVVLASCGGGGTTPITDVTVTPSGLRALPFEYTHRKAVNYSPYRTALSPEARGDEVISDAMVEQDLRLILASGIGLIRLFESDDKVGARTLRIIASKNLDIKVHLGIYIQAGNDAFSNDQIARGVALANSYPDIVLAVSVGNETMVSWSTTKMLPAVMARHLAYVRSQIRQPITSDDDSTWYDKSERVNLDVIDFVAMHSYAMIDTHFLPDAWDWKQLGQTDLSKRAADMMKASITYTKTRYNAVRNYLDQQGYGALPIVIGETGWKAVDSSGADWYKFRAHPVNQKMYYDALQAWALEGRSGAGPKAIFYFEAFDEPWKGSDDKWGLFNVNREARYAVQALHPADSVVGGTATGTVTWKYEGCTYTDASAKYWKPTTLNAVVAQNRYVIYSEANTASDLRQADAFLRFDPFAQTFWTEVADAAPGDGTKSYEIDPRPELWGWGMLYQSNPVGCGAEPVSTNLSSFANGTLTLSLKTTYDQAANGKLEIGISSDTEVDGAVEAYVQLKNGDYGYCNTGAWCKVSIPIKDFVAKNPKLDLRFVLSRFIIADRYVETGKGLKPDDATRIKTKIKLDAVYWSK